MNQIDTPDSEQIDTTPPSVVMGQHLREAREALGLTRDDVARELRLHEKLIAALEAGDRSQLPPDTFISGYLRSYARLLGLPAEPLIAEYLAERVVPSVYRATDRTGVKVVTSRDPKFKLMSFAVVAVIALLFAAWWANERFSLLSPAPLQEGDGSEEQQDLTAALPAPMPLYQESAGEAQPLGQDEAGVPPADDASSLPGAVPEPAPAPAVTAEPPAAVEAPAPPAEAPPVEIAKPAPVVVVTEPLAASVPQSSLDMEYQAASWTQVEDAKGRVLIYETIPAGRKLHLQGVAPFKVFLGYAPGVLVYYNGTLFPHSAYQRGDLARFRVGASADNRPLDR